MMFLLGFNFCSLILSTSFLFKQSKGKLDVLLINLDKRQDKLTICDYQLKQLNRPDYTRISGVDGASLFDSLSKSPSSNISDLLNVDWIKAERTHVTATNKNQVGCTLSHLKVLKHIIANDIQNPVLILEDDFGADAEAIVKTENVIEMLPADWSLFYAGHCHYPTNSYFVNYDGHYIGEVDDELVPCSHAYVVNGAEAAKKFLDAGNTEKLELADFFAQKAQARRFIIYPFLFTQLREIPADIKSEGGTWYTMKNESLLQEVKQKFIQ